MNQKMREAVQLARIHGIEVVDDRRDRSRIVEVGVDAHAPAVVGLGEVDARGLSAGAAQHPRSGAGHEVLHPRCQGFDSGDAGDLV